MVTNPSQVPIHVPIPASLAYKNILLNKISQRTNSMTVDCLASAQWPEIVDNGETETERTNKYDQNEMI